MHLVKAKAMFLDVCFDLSHPADNGGKHGGEGGGLLRSDLVSCFSSTVSGGRGAWRCCWWWWCCWGGWWVLSGRWQTAGGVACRHPPGGPLRPPDGLIRQEVLLERLTALVSHVSAKQLKCSLAAAALWCKSLADLDHFYCFESKNSPSLKSKVAREGDHDNSLMINLGNCSIL